MTDPSRIIVGDVIDGLRSLDAGSVHCCVTSPPYWGLRDYGVDGQIGLEKTPDEFVAKMVDVFREVRRVLRDDGTLWLNLGDSYASSGRSQRKESPGVGAKQEMDAPGRSLEWEAGGGHNFSWYIPTEDGRIKPKDLCMIPWRVALALQADGWWLRSVICWAKKSPMPESVTDRPTSSWEPIFLLAKSDRYFYDAEAVKEASERGHAGSRFDVGKTGVQGLGRCQIGEREDAGTRNQRNVWHLGPEPFSGWTESVHWQPVEADAVGDGIRRTPSEDCPVHGCRGSRPDDEHAACSLNHSRGTCDYPAQEPLHESECIATRHDQQNRVCGSDSPRPVRSETANVHSTQTHRTDHAPATIQPCTPCAQTHSDTPGTSETPESSDSAGHTTDSNTGEGCVQGASGSSPSGQTGFGSGGICTCQYHRRVTKKIDHFATFPTEIPRRAIKAGTSEKGCCAACGAPWRRVVERTSIKRERPNDYTKRDGEDGTGNSCANSVAGVDVRTLGWEPTCTCGAAVVPCVVLDPFLGSGTTVAVARELGRYGVGCELNPEYAKLARERIGRAERPATFRSERVIDSPLFGGVA